MVGRHTLEKIQVVVSLILVASTLVFQSKAITLGMLCGVSISLFNTYAMAHVFRAMDEKSKIARILVFNILKLACVFGAIYLVVRYTHVNLIAFVVGLSAMIVSFIGTFLFRLTKQRGT